MRALPICIALGLTFIAGSVARAADRCCDMCGCNCCVQKFCVCKKTEKEITKTCWDVKCEDVCVPGCSELCCEVCKQDKCGCWSYNIWKPACACVKTRRVPVKTEVKRKVPSYEWVVEYRCVNCCKGGCGKPCETAGQAAPSEGNAPLVAAAPTPVVAAPVVAAPAQPYAIAENPSARRQQ
ncbi:MAG TPA: hypothetical protein VGJ26_11675 [Pirellulales bacterium]|jgi:hypothetical protein